eukprot:15208554-Ditylum_brightwellii.AAC.1
MEGATHDVEEVNSDIDSRSEMSHIGETDNFYNTNESVPENDERTILESDDALSNTSACLSEGVHAATVIGYAYGLQSFGSVMPKFLPSMVQDLSNENSASNCMQPKGITDVSMLPSLDVPTPYTANTANAQEAVYSDVEISCIVNKRPISDFTRAVRDIAVDTEELSSKHTSNSGHEQSLIGCSVSSTGTVDGDSTSGYDSDGNIPFWDPIAAAEDTNTYVEGVVEET